ncbi:major facilitator family transporter [Candidatus Nitrosoglobus terrae]|uniref:Major facilitator family transporter n=2 Tax=Candidatus Nitrosoglobus terrae TaxID=1630141 RepID=A0A1Q2SJZ4_9GAMM|nr:major facilitator family transporter [Candidatus Nitrosoglobus terrae]
MGFSSGLPLLLTSSVLQAWMQQEGVDLTTIGLFALVGLPYTLKFFWAPFLDRYQLGRLGRRRGWLLWAQIGLILALVGLGFTKPAVSPINVAGAALLVTFFSAVQDIVIDAYRREILTDHELGLGSALYVNGYRLGMLLASGGGLILADYLSFPQIYELMALIMLVGVITTLLAPEPKTFIDTPRTIREAIVDPFLEYFQRQNAVLILFFILFYKIGDAMASHMTIPFYLDLGYSTTEIGMIAKGFGFGATVCGSLLGGILMLRMGIYRSLWLFGILQAVSTVGFAVLGSYGYSLLGLALVIAFENLTGGMGTAAYVAFMASLTNKKFTATQYALLSSLMGIPRAIIAAPAGFFAKSFGWVSFFSFCALIAIPGLLLLRHLRPKLLKI